MTKRWLYCVVSLLFGVAAGVSLGMWELQHRIRVENTASLWFKEGLLDDFAKRQYRYADGQSAREALLHAVDAHKAMQAEKPSGAEANKIDWTICYGELSMLEESVGHTELAGNYMAQAQQVLKDAGYKDASEAFVRGLLKGPFGGSRSDAKQP